MAREGFLTYLENYFKKHEIDLKKIPFELKSIDAAFSIAAEAVIMERYNPSVAALRKNGFIKMSENGTLYIELESIENVRLIIANGYVQNKKAIFVTEKDFEKMAMGMDYVYFEKIKNHSYFNRFIREFNQLPCSANLIKDSFQVVASKIRKQDQADKRKIEKLKEEELMKSVSQIYFVDPEAAENRQQQKTETIESTEVVKHKEVSLYERHKRMLELDPVKAIKASGINENSSSYFACLYNVEKLEDNSTLYALVMEPNTSYRYTKTAYFKSNQPVTDEKFQNKVAEYLQYSSDVIHALANTTRFCHKTIESFEDMLNEVIFDEYNSPVHKKKLKLAKATAEPLDQGWVEAIHR